MIWSYAVMVLAFLVVTVIGELLPFMKDLEAAINQSRRAYVGSAIAVLVLGFTAFMGGVICGAVRGVRSRGPRDPIPERLRGRRQIAGGGFSIEVSFREMKEAWRSGVWLPPPWGGVGFFIGAGPGGG